MKKSVLITMFVVSLIGAAYAASVGTATVAAGSLSATYENAVTPVRNVALKGAYITFGANVNDTIIATITDDSVVYQLDSVSIANTTAVARIDFDIDAVLEAGATVSFTRTTASTNTAMNVMVIYE